MCGLPLPFGWQLHPTISKDFPETTGEYFADEQQRMLNKDIWYSLPLAIGTVHLLNSEVIPQTDFR